VKKKVIVTGSEGLLGKEISRYLEEKEYRVLRCSRRLGQDLSQEGFVRSWFKENKADYLINLFALNDHVHPGRSESTMFDVSLGSFTEYLERNIVSLFSVCREFARSNTGGGIINFSSICGMVSPNPGLYDGHKHIGYCVSKAGVILMTKYLAVHLAPKYRVNCISPGGVLFDQSEDFVRKYSMKVPLGRMMNVDEVNGIVAFLCSDKSLYCTGTNFVVDGGYTII